MIVQTKAHPMDGLSLEIKSILLDDLLVQTLAGRSQTQDCDSEQKSFDESECTYELGCDSVS
jgi:hypothetical protein